MIDRIDALFTALLRFWWPGGTQRTPVLSDEAIDEPELAERAPRQATSEAVVWTPDDDAWASLEGTGNPESDRE